MRDGTAVKENVQILPGRQVAQSDGISRGDRHRAAVGRESQIADAADERFSECDDFAGLGIPLAKLPVGATDQDRLAEWQDRRDLRAARRERAAESVRVNSPDAEFAVVASQTSRPSGVKAMAAAVIGSSAGTMRDV